MNATELTERLLGDLKSSILTRASTPDIFTQIDNIGVGKPGDFLGALNAIPFDQRLSIISQILNFGSYDAIEVFNFISENKEVVIVKIDEILNNDDVIDLKSGTKLNEDFIEVLNDLHKFSGSKL